ncbi:NADPH:quinone oxidoreductase family protein [Microbacterium sp. AGC85]
MTAYEGPSGLVLEDVPEPVRCADDLLVAVDAIGVNFPDLLMTRGQYQLKPELPFVPGCELAGTVIEASPHSGWSVGERVSSFVWTGAYAERATIPVATAARIPDDIEATTAAAMIVNYQTVLFALDRRARLRSGETVLVLGAAGGIGSAAVQIARGLGATVIAGIADEQQRVVAERSGADQVVVLEQGFASTVKDIAGGRGIDVVVDPLGDWLFDEAVRTLAPEGRIVVIGFAAGKIPTIAVNRLLLRNASVIGAAWGAFLDLEPELVSRQTDAILGMLRSGAVRPQIDRIGTFAELPQELERLSRGEIRGKSVVSFAQLS